GAGSVIGTDTSNGGADGTKSVTYALTNAAGGNFTGQDSGLIATLTGNHIFLYTEGNLIVGREGTGAVANPLGAIAIELFLDANNKLDLAQYEAIKHNRSEEHTSELQSPYNLMSRLLLVTKTIND